MSKSHLEKFTADPERMRLFQQERLIMSVTEMICAAMKEKGVKQVDLAQLLGKSKGRISQYLAGEKNLTLRTVADIFTALGLTLRPRLEPLSIQETKGRLFELNPAGGWSRPSAWKSPDWVVAEFTCDDQALAG